VLILPGAVISPKANGWSIRERLLVVDQQGGVLVLAQLQRRRR
jgi:hypothetical protein